MSTVLVTGAAGFIGFHVASRLARQGVPVVGVDSLTSYYSVELKLARLRNLAKLSGFQFDSTDLANRTACSALFDTHRPDRVIHLAAQPGVRFGVLRPDVYVDSNLVAFANVLEGCRHSGTTQFLYASSSSVYGNGGEVPYTPMDRADQPLSLYAATKRANELMAHAYAHLFKIESTAMRFFTVYGPWGRPDMAVYSFTKSLFDGLPIEVYHGGALWRDYTFIDDVVEAVLGLLSFHPTPDPNGIPHRVFNIGNDQPIDVTELIGTLERLTGKQAHLVQKPMQAGDVLRTHADVTALKAAVGFAPHTPLADGLRQFVDWYRDYHGVQG